LLRNRVQREGKQGGPKDGVILPLETLERQAITAALERFGKSTRGKRLAAKALKISIATLYRKIREYGLSD
ncbi:MAG: sigma-54-dependent Fis family transcriptional regulator, partial [Deltaproteobacteria bacterium]